MIGLIKFILIEERFYMNKEKIRRAILEEYNLICSKESELSRKQRDKIIECIEKAVLENYLYHENDSELLKELGF